MVDGVLPNSEAQTCGFCDTQISKEQKIIIKVYADPRSGPALQHLQIHITAGTGSVRPTFVKISSSFLFAET